MFRADFGKIQTVGAPGRRQPGRRARCARLLCCNFAANPAKMGRKPPQTVGIIGHNANSSGACLHSFRHFCGDPPRFYKPGGLFRHASWRSSSPQPHVRPTLWLLDAAASADFKSILLFCFSASASAGAFLFSVYWGWWWGMFSNLRRKREASYRKTQKIKFSRLPYGNITETLRVGTD